MVALFILFHLTALSQKNSTMQFPNYSACETPAAVWQPRTNGFTTRAFGIGLVMVGVIIGLTQALSVQHSAAEVGGNAPPPTPIYLLFFYVLLLAPLLRRLAPKLAFTRAELLLIYAMMLVAGPIAHPFAIAFLVPHTVAPLYYNAQEPGWAIFKDTLPAWMGPNSPAAVKTFFQGGDGTVPWAAWLLPILAWSCLLIVLFFVMLCIDTLMRRQWIDSERLTFPLATIPLVLTEEIGGNEERHTTVGGRFLGSQPLSVIRQPLFWLGLAIPLLLQAPSAIHKVFPAMPDLPLRDIILVNGTTLSPPWNGLGQIEFHVIFWLIGIAYLLPKEITFSCWAFYLIALLENVTAVWRGTSGEMPDIYGGDFPALYAQGAGAAFALAGITVFAARRHLLHALRQALRNAPDGADRGEFLSYRTAFAGAALGIAFLLGWFCLAGMRFWVAALLFGLLLCYFFLFARIRAETGLGMGVILFPKMLDDVMLALVGARYMRLPDLTVLYALRWIYHSSATGSVMACQLEGFKLAEAGGMRGKRFGGALALVTTLAVPLVFAWTLKTYYAHGFENMPIGQRSTSMVGSQIYWSFQNLATARSEAAGPQWNTILAMLSGGLITVAISWLRMQFLWFPLHPVGYLAANAWGMHINWASFFFGWLLNFLITRYGGLSVYRRILPVFLGLIVGAMVHEGVWGLVTWVTGGTQ